VGHGRVLPLVRLLQSGRLPSTNRGFVHLTARRTAFEEAVQRAPSRPFDRVFRRGIKLADCIDNALSDETG
jgi:hypothetical protein